MIFFFTRWDILVSWRVNGRIFLCSNSNQRCHVTWCLSTLAMLEGEASGKQVMRKRPVMWFVSWWTSTVYMQHICMYCVYISIHLCTSAASMYLYVYIYICWVCPPASNSGKWWFVGIPHLTCNNPSGMCFSSEAVGPRFYVYNNVIWFIWCLNTTNSAKNSMCKLESIVW